MMMVVVFMGVMGVMGIVIVIIVIVVMVVFMFIVIIIIIFFLLLAPCPLLLINPFYGRNPGGAGGYLVEVEHVGVENLVEIHVAVVTFDDVGFGLEGTDNLFDAGEFFWTHLCGFVQEHDVAELNLLDDQVFNVFLADVGFLERIA